MADERSEATNRDDLDAPFLFVPRGDPLPTDWMARHPGWIKVPATMVPRGSQSPSRAPSPGAMQAAGLGITASAAAMPGALAELGEAGAGGLAELLGAGAIAPLMFLGILLRPSQISDGPPPPLPLGPGTGAGEGFVPPSPTPAPPGLVPPVESKTKPGEGGFTPAPPAPALPGFTPTPAQSNVLPGHPVEEQGATILQHDRNERLDGGARTNSRRAREAARAADPAVTRALQDAEWRAHHLINIAAARRSPDLLAAAARAGWRTDDASNVAPLPASPAAREKLGAAGIHRPVHDSGHRNWNNEVLKALADIELRLDDEGMASDPGSYERRAREELERLQNDLRQKMLEFDRLTRNDAAIQSAMA